MKNTYKIDFVNNTLTMTKAFEDAASNPTSQEYKLLQQIPRRLPRPDYYPQDPPRPLRRPAPPRT